MDEILKMLGIDKLDESKQTEIREKFDTLIQVKVDEKVVEKQEEMKDSLVEEYENKYNEYKEDMTEKFSNFVDDVLDEEMSIPDYIKEYARKGELYTDLIEQFKIRLAIDENVVDEEMKDLLKECKTEIQSLKDQTNELISDNMTLKTDAKEFAANIYLREKAEDLPLKQKERVFSLLEGVTDTVEINKKFDVIVESVKNDDGAGDKDNLNEGKNDNYNQNPDEDNEPKPFDNMVTYWNKILSESKTA